MPYVPKVLPAVIPDPAVRRRAEEAFLSEDFKENIESYFVDNIKVLLYNIISKMLLKNAITYMVSWDRNYLNSLEFQNEIQAPLNRQIIKSSETIMSVIDMVETLMNAFLPTQTDANGVNDKGTTDNKPRAYDTGYGGTISQLVNFAQTLYSLSKK